MKPIFQTCAAGWEVWFELTLSLSCAFLKCQVKLLNSEKICAEISVQERARDGAGHQDPAGVEVSWIA